ncbi:sodium:calcium antiporter [Pelosinus baikalensis]|uniref:Sodium:calcium antiporter n=1 Tax=Pelosinus baikalensis TaxID=2892015 RepID=A0ABS8HYE6_9FIRM|nr:sodium:calcium antiporter [Pelosinus baikalensis]MCC5467534.1 sodium:calcium antiporter [Pelosinus baikalensis]
MLNLYVTLLVAIIVIYYSCELFVNAIEWFGRKFNVAQCAVGTILAAFGTALPESVVTLMAVAFNSSAEQKDIGIGAALGGPLVLGTISYAVVGLCIIFFRKKRDLGVEIDIDSKKLSRDQLWFVSIFIFKVLMGLFIFSLKPLAGILFLSAYAFYFYKEMGAECVISEEVMEPLTFQPKKKDPTVFWVLSQTFISLMLIFISSHLFVKNLEALSVSWNMSPLILSLLISPIATELPEILNAVIWVRQGKETLALGNISGAMMIQATIPTALGLFFTPWLFDFHLIWAGCMTLLSIFYLLLTLKQDKLSPQRLVYAGGFYLLFSCIFFIK